MSVQLQIETIGGICNARCHFCLLNDPKYYKNQGVPTGVMDWGLYTKIVYEAKTIPVIDHLTLTGLSETLLDRRLEERIEYARELRAEVGLSRWLIDIYTNGLALTPERHDKLADVGLDAVHVSLNATNPEQHHSVMGMGLQAFDRICANIDYAIAQGKLDVYVKAVFSGDHFTLADADAFNARWGKHAVVVWEGNWAGATRDIERPRHLRNECCNRAINQIYVTWEGKVGMCCLDPLAKANFGDLTQQSLRDVYASKRYVDFREDHANNQADKHDVCAVCTRI